VRLAEARLSPANTFTISSADPVLAGAGDIADCGTSARDEETAQLLDGLPTAGVFTLGDNAYNSGTAAEFQNCYAPTWGRHKARTRPSAGNHDYGTAGAAGYFGYFGATAGEPGKGWYSYDVGAWHVVVLNTNCYPVGGCDPGDPQVAWLRADLAAHPADCTLAYWHHPLFTSRRDSQEPASATFWQVLYEAGADLILTGHAHVYERFAPQTPTGALDLAYGIRQITAGTGGYSLYTFDSTPAPNSQVRFNDAHGVLKLTLHPTSYEWQFLPIAGATSTDSGTTACHGAPGGSPPPPPRPPPSPPPAPPPPAPPPPAPPSPVPPSPPPAANPPGALPPPPPPVLHPPVDTAPPDTRITSGPRTPTTARRATFRFVSSEAGSRFECKLDSGPWRACASPHAYRRLRLGLHAFRVRATDSTGNVDATAAVRRWRITRPPQ
jgi:calcineurin-like phosphoesterase family protein